MYTNAISKFTNINRLTVDFTIIKVALLTDAVTIKFRDDAKIRSLFKAEVDRLICRVNVLTLNSNCHFSYYIHTYTNTKSHS